MAAAYMTANLDLVTHPDGNMEYIQIPDGSGQVHCKPCRDAVMHPRNWERGEINHWHYMPVTLDGATCTRCQGSI